MCFMYGTLKKYAFVVCALCCVYFLGKEKRAVCVCGLCVVCFLGKKKHEQSDGTYGMLCF